MRSECCEEVEQRLGYEDTEVHGLLTCSVHAGSGPLVAVADCGVKPRLHDTTCCQTGCQHGLTRGFIVYTNIQPVVKPVLQPV